MPRNTARRTEEEMCSDLAIVLSNNALHDDTKRSVLDSILWTWTTLNGKYKGCRWWSPDANARYLSTGNFKDLRHEHVVPRREIRKILLVEHKSPTYEEIREILSTFCLAIVVTKEEDARLNRMGLRSKMPDDWDCKDRWARYKAAGIMHEAQRKP